MLTASRIASATRAVLREFMAGRFEVNPARTMESRTAKEASRICDEQQSLVRRNVDSVGIEFGGGSERLRAAKAPRNLRRSLVVELSLNFINAEGFQEISFAYIVVSVEPDTAFHAVSYFLCVIFFTFE